MPNFFKQCFCKCSIETVTLSNIEILIDILSSSTWTRYSWIGLTDAEQEGTFKTILGGPALYVPSLTEPNQEMSDCFGMKPDESWMTTRPCTGYCCSNQMKTVCRHNQLNQGKI